MTVRTVLINTVSDYNKHHPMFYYYLHSWSGISKCRGTASGHVVRGSAKHAEVSVYIFT